MSENESASDVDARGAKAVLSEKEVGRTEQVARKKQGGRDMMK